MQLKKSLVCLSVAVSVVSNFVPGFESAARAAERFSLFGWGKNQDDASKDDDAQSGTPETLNENEPTASDDSEIEAGEAPPAIEISPQGPVIQRVPWRKTDFGNQVGALGYKMDTFAVPDGFHERVNFWVSIYSKYTTDQGVMHDTVYPSVVYDPIDFGPITKDPGLNPVRKRHARERMIKEHRATIEERLRRLQNAKTADGLQGEDLRYWKMFERESSPTKFIDATRKGRIRFQLGQKDRFALGIYYSGRYLAEMEKIFREENLPVELTRLPFVESSFNIYARSKVGASGIWQFMRRTARPYMMVNSAVDERNDPLRETRSAAKLLRANFDLLGSWPLALTGWNHGPTGLLKIMRKTDSHDLVKIIQTFSSRRFGFASENFYACFLAALEVERHAHKYFGDVKWSVPLEHAEVHLSKPLPYEAVHVWFEGDDELAQLYNPHFSKGVRKGRQSMPRGTNVRIPKVMEPFALAYLDGKTSLQKMREAIAQAKIKVAYPTVIEQAVAGLTQPPLATHAPNLPQVPTLAPAVAPSSPVVAAAPTPAAITIPNPPPNPSPNPSPTGEPLTTPALAAKLAGLPEETRPAEYKVGRGDRLIKIAEKFGLSKGELKAANPKLRRTDSVMIGQILLIPPLPSSSRPFSQPSSQPSSQSEPSVIPVPASSRAVGPSPTATPTPKG